MEAIVLTGLPGSGKSSCYADRFFATHTRLAPPALEDAFEEVWRMWPAVDGGFGSTLAGGDAAGRDDAGRGAFDTPPRWSRGVAARR